MNVPQPDVALGHILERAQQGDRAAFAALYESYSRRVFGLCRKLLGSHEAARDATSEVFVRVQQRLSSFDTSKAFTPWLLSVTGNYCCDVLRRRKRTTKIFSAAPLEPGEVGSGDASPLSAVADAAQRDRVLEAIESLPDRYRAVVVLRYYGDRSYDEIASDMGIERNTVATLLFRARKRLRTALQTEREEIA